MVVVELLFRFLFSVSIVESQIFIISFFKYFGFVVSSFYSRHFHCTHIGQLLFQCNSSRHQWQNHKIKSKTKEKKKQTFLAQKYLADRFAFGSQINSSEKKKQNVGEREKHARKIGEFAMRKKKTTAATTATMAMVMKKKRNRLK